MDLDREWRWFTKSKMMVKKEKDDIVDGDILQTRLRR